jgi:cupin 2 domain-containing protein
MNILGNILEVIGHSQEGEITENLLDGQDFRLERIVSMGQRTPDGEWYDQSADEWVALLTGKAQLRFEGSNDVINLDAGDYLNIPAHRRHRIEWTAPSEPTIWIAIHYSAKTTS